MDQEETTKMQDTLTTGANETDIYERKVQHKCYDKSERHVFTTDSNDTMKDGPRRSAKMQDTLTTDANERSKTYYILRRKRTTRVYYDGCER